MNMKWHRASLAKGSLANPRAELADPNIKPQKKLGKKNSEYSILSLAHCLPHNFSDAIEMYPTPEPPRSRRWLA